MVAHWPNFVWTYVNTVSQVFGLSHSFLEQVCDLNIWVTFWQTVIGVKLKDSKIGATASKNKQQQKTTLIKKGTNPLQLPSYTYLYITSP